MDKRSLLRVREAHDHGRVTYVELFFDLVFVFAVTQLSHLMRHHLSTGGGFETLLLLLAVWWAWIDTSWVTNWLDPERPAVRVMLFALMFIGLLLSASIPAAFGPQALVFAAAYACMQIGRSLFTLWALRRHDRRNFRNFQRILAWHLLIGAMWVAGALRPDPMRMMVWTVAVIVECTVPLLGFRVPGLGRSSTADWDVDGGHMAERCALFVIIALGESILVTGTTAAAESAGVATVAAFVLAFLGSVALWWIYFNIGAQRGSQHIAAAADPGRLARAAYTYVHMLIVCGIVVTAVADWLVLSRPAASADLRATTVIAGGPALYVLGNLLFKHASAPHLPLSHLVGLGLLAVLAAIATHGLSLLALSAAVTAILIAVAAWETVSLRSAGTP